MRNRELEPQKSIRPRTWHVKQIADKGKPSTNIDMVFILPAEPKAPSECERSNHKRLRNEIVKEGVIKIDGGHQQSIQVVGSEDIS